MIVLPNGPPKLRRRAASPRLHRAFASERSAQHRNTNDLLRIEVPAARRQALGSGPAVRDVSITLRSGEVLGIVGESGAGKSTIGNAIVNLLDAPGEIVRGKVIFEGQNLVGMDDKAMRTIRGKRIGMIFQDPQTSLNQ